MKDLANVRKGTVVKYLGGSQSQIGESYKSLLTIGKEYTINNVNAFGGVIKISLEDYPGAWFRTDNFEEVKVAELDEIPHSEIIQRNACDESLIGKTVVGLVELGPPDWGHDDRVWLRIDFSDNTFIVVPDILEDSSIEIFALEPIRR